MAFIDLPFRRRKIRVSDRRTISHYRVIEKLAAADGVVYKAEDVTLHRFVALKFLPKKQPKLQALARLICYGLL